MDLTKYQKLAKALKEMVERIDAFFDRVEGQLNLTQFHFHEPFLIVGRPLMQEQAVKSMMKIYSLGIGFFMSSKVLSSKWLGAIITPAFYPASRILISADSQDHWSVPWRVKTVPPSNFEANLQNCRIESLLYCPAEVELTHSWTEWEDEEDSHFSITNQFHLLLDASKEHTRLKANLAQPAFIHFKTLIEKWEWDNYFHRKEYPVDFEALAKTPFVPKTTTSIALAYEAVLKVQSSGRYRNYSEIIQAWKDSLKRLIFTDLQWTQKRQSEFLNKCQRRYLKKPSPHQKKRPGRWDSTQAIDRQTAGRFIRYFLNHFISNPKHKHNGEIALILMTMIWASRQPNHSNISVKTILSLKYSQVDLVGYQIYLGNQKVEISEGLGDLLNILVGENTKHTTSKIFRYVSIDRFEDALKRASRELLGTNAQPVSPAAFLCFPHPFYGQRFSATQREALYTGRKIEGYSFSRECVANQLQSKSSI